jgi:hypothetical protein
VRKYLSSDAAEEDKKRNIMCRDLIVTCLHLAWYRDPPDNIIKAMIDIGGKELVIKIDINDRTALHWACYNGASYNIIRMLIEVGGKDLVMAKNDNGNTALHDLCWFIEGHTKVAEKVKLILQVGDANLLLSAKNLVGKTPLKLATEEGASNIIKKLLTVQSTTNFTRSNSSTSAIIVPADNRTPITQSNQEQDAPVAGIQMMKQEEGEAANAQELLEESNRRAADLEATVETQRSKIADLLNEKDDIEKECVDKVDKLTRELLKQQAELQLLKDSSSDVEVGRMKRKHTNEEHGEGEGTPVVQSQSQSSKRSKGENATNISSVSLDINQAEDEDAAVIAGYNMLMRQHMATRRELRNAKARNVELIQEVDDLAI